MIRNFLPVIAFLLAANADMSEGAANPEATATFALRDTVNSLGIRLLQELSLRKDENVLVSPWAAVSSLLMLSEGATGNSLEQIRESLSISEDVSGLSYPKVLSHIMDKATNMLNIANALFLDNRFKPRKEYVDVIRRTYNGTVEHIDYSNTLEASNAINNWADQNTEGNINGLVAPGFLDPDTELLLTNVVYFKSKWNTPFRPNLPWPEMFFPRGFEAEPISVQIMHKRQRVSYGKFKELECEAVLLPYEDNKFHMLVLLPNKNSSVETVLSKITSVEDIVEKMTSKSVIIGLPKFKITSNQKLKAPLGKLGIKDVFSMKADLTGISADSKLKVTDAIHKAAIEVNEEGTPETTFGGMQHHLLDDIVDAMFIVNRPFITFVLKNNSGIAVLATVVGSP